MDRTTTEFVALDFCDRYSLVSAFTREENSKGGVAIYKKTSMEVVESLNMEKKSIPLVCEIAVASVRLQGKGTFFVLAIYQPSTPESRSCSPGFSAFVRHN